MLCSVTRCLRTGLLNSDLNILDPCQKENSTTCPGCSRTQVENISEPVLGHEKIPHVEFWKFWNSDHVALNLPGRILELSNGEDPSMVFFCFLFLIFIWLHQGLVCSMWDLVP